MKRIHIMMSIAEHDDKHTNDDHDDDNDSNDDNYM